MNSIFYNERPLVVNRELAKLVGFEESVILQQLHYWLELNKKDGRNFYKDKYWTYNSISQWQETEFDFWSFEQVRKNFSKIEKAGLVFIDNFNKDKRDRTKWYSINYEKIAELRAVVHTNKKQQAEKKLDEMQLAESQKAIGEITKCNTPNNQMEYVKQPNASPTNDPMQHSHLTQPLPEITTETSNISQSVSPMFIFNEDQKNVKTQDGLDRTNMQQKSLILSNLERNVLSKEEYTELKERIHENIDYATFIEYGSIDSTIKTSKEDLDDIIQVIMDVMVTNPKQFIKIQNEEKPAHIIQEVFLKIQGIHIENVLQKYKHMGERINNTKMYLRSMLYNEVLENNLNLTNQVISDQSWGKTFYKKST